MDRRKFIVQASIATIFARTLFTSAGWARGLNPGSDLVEGEQFAFPEISEKLKTDFLGVLEWMNSASWIEHIKNTIGITLPVNDPLHPDLFKILNLDLESVEGWNDFAGNKFIEPGNPALSLLYHLLASPRVLLPANLTSAGESSHYPTLPTLDILENFIYATKPIDLKAINAGTMVLAMFAYEYRPACKTPHECHADLVFSRTGFSRIGTEVMASYDSKNRCFVNCPESGSENEIAVTPARYGLFLAQKVSYAEVSRNNPITLDRKDDLQFLLPIRKIFDEDICINGFKLFFEESHVNEKLKRLCIFQGLQLSTACAFDLNKPPFVYKSSSSTNPNKTYTPGKYENTMVSIHSVGSSVLINSVPKDLVKEAVQVINGKPERVRIKIPALKEGGVPISFSNRRYSSLKLLEEGKQKQDGWDIVNNHLFYGKRQLTEYNAHRNSPLFVYIRDVVDERTGKTIRHLNETFPDILKETNKSYFAGLFEDNICDGCVYPELVRVEGSNASSANIKLRDTILRLPRLSAFSVVTAPDFFPLVESYDMMPFEQMFLLGGVEDMGGARKRANPSVTLPGSANEAFPWRSQNKLENLVQNTVVALISAQEKENTRRRPRSTSIAEADKLTRTNFLPDSATKIFYPGWDITYSGGKDVRGKEHGTFYATYGLGSPFVEDSKLCAAVNGMWAAASPDSARTFRNSLTKVPTSLIRRVFPPTAVPLLDNELGYHRDSPASLEYSIPPSTGWDGEQGPFIVKRAGVVVVNFTDIARSDYIANVKSSLFDMSKLRKITTANVKYRMDCYQRSLRELGLKNDEVWLLGAEYVRNWGNGADGFCIPQNLHTNNNSWATRTRIGKAGDGFLFLVGTTTKVDPTPLPNSKRMEQECQDLYLIQVNRNDLAACYLERPNWNAVWM